MRGTTYITENGTVKEGGNGIATGHATPTGNAAAAGGPSIYERLAESNALTEVEERAHGVYDHWNVPTSSNRSPALPSWQ